MLCVYEVEPCPDRMEQEKKWYDLPGHSEAQGLLFPLEKSQHNFLLKRLFKVIMLTLKTYGCLAILQGPDHHSPVIHWSLISANNLKIELPALPQL